MPKINPITNSLKESFLVIKNHKKTFLLILILQFLFFLLIILVSSYFMSKILQNTMNIVEYTDNLNLNPDSYSLDMLQQRNPLGEDPLSVSRNYDEIIKNALFLIFSIFLIFAIINGLIWYFSINISSKIVKLIQLKNILSYLFKFFMISIIISLIFYLMLYNLMNIFFSKFLLTKPINFVPLLIISLILLYFTYIAIPLINNIKLNKKEIANLAKTIFSLGTKKFKILILSYFIIVISILIPFLLIFYFIESNLILLFFSLILLLLVFVWSKIYFAIIVKKLSSF